MSAKCKPSAAVRRTCALLAALGALVGAPATGAHEASPAHGCTAPVRPADEQDDLLWAAFLEDVDRFRACISSHVDANYAAADRHREAAERAALEWNHFVRDSLNAPKDYPWPPPAPGTR
jgi:hypothetical protein